MHDKKHHLLLAASGSVATIKLPNIINGLAEHKNLSIRILLTKSATHFLNNQSTEQPTLEDISRMRDVDGIYQDEDEWAKPWVRGAAILHIELRRWADVLVVAPLSANTMAKITAGLADNLLTSVIRAWDTTGVKDVLHPSKRIYLAPAMNTAMWRHPVTAKQLYILEEEWGVRGPEKGWIEVLRPVEKELACGDVGDGGMIDWRYIVDVIGIRLLQIEGGTKQ